jgi:hypothetical protein
MHTNTIVREFAANAGREFIANVDVLLAHGLDPLNIEFPEAEVQILSASQRQGDVFLLKVTSKHAGDPIPNKGIVVVRAETNSANTHSLHGDGLWEPNARAADPSELVQGWLTVAAGSEAFLIHTEEHNALGIGEGTYEIRRQREFAGEWQRVAD